MASQRSFASKLSLCLLAATAVVYLGAVVGIGYLVVRSVKKEAVGKAEAALSLAKAEIETNLSGVQVATNSFAVIAEDCDSQYAFELTRKFLHGNSLIVGTSLAFPGGQYAPYAYWSADTIVSKTLEYDYSNSDWYTVTEESWCEPYYDEGGAYMLMTTYSVPLSNGRVLTADVSLESITSCLENVVLPYDNAYTFLVSSTGRLLSNVPDASVKQFYKEMASGNNGMAEFETKGTKYTIVYSPLSNGWSEAIVCPHKDIFAGARSMNIILIIISVVGFVLVYIADKLLIARLTRPLLEFTASKERFERETAIASSIQLNMVPHTFPHSRELDIFASMIPAKEVGGDLYDFHVKGDDMYFAIGDVSGKGVPAALFMALTRSSFRFASGMGIPMNEVVARINDAICEGNETNMFVTLFAGRFNRKTNVLEFCNAGHNPVVMISPEGKAEYLKATPNLAAGLMEHFSFELQSVTLAPGTRLLLYTDGVTEAETSAKEQYGERRLLDFASAQSASDSSEDFVGHLLDSVRKFTSGAVQNDDITAMCIRL